MSKNIIIFGRSVTDVGVGGENPDESQFEVKNNEEVNFLDSQGGGYRANYHRLGGNHGLNKDECWRDRDRD